MKALLTTSQILAERAIKTSIDPVVVMMGSLRGLSEHHFYDYFTLFQHQRIARVAVAIVRNVIPDSLEHACHALDSLVQFLDDPAEGGLFTALGAVERQLDTMLFVRAMRGFAPPLAERYAASLEAVLDLGRFATSRDNKDALIAAVDFACEMSAYRFGGYGHIRRAVGTCRASASYADFARWALAELSGPTMAEQLGLPDGEIWWGDRPVLPLPAAEMAIPPAQWNEETLAMLRQFYVAERAKELAEGEGVDPKRMASRMLEALGPELSIRFSREVSPTAIVDFNPEDEDNTEHEICKKVLAELKKAAKKAAKAKKT